MRKSGGGIIVSVFWLNPDKWDDWKGSQEASQILCQAKKREMVGGGGILCHEWNKKKKITMVLHSVSAGRMHSSTDSSLWAAAGRGLCQRCSGLPGWRLAEGSCQWWTSDHNRRRHTLQPLIDSKPTHRSSCRLPRGPHTDGRDRGESEDGFCS